MAGASDCPRCLTRCSRKQLFCGGCGAALPPRAERVHLPASSRRRWIWLTIGLAVVSAGGAVVGWRPPTLVVRFVIAPTREPESAPLLGRTQDPSDPAGGTASPYALPGRTASPAEPAPAASRGHVAGGTASPGHPAAAANPEPPLGVTELAQAGGAANSAPRPDGGRAVSPAAAGPRVSPTRDAPPAARPRSSRQPTARPPAPAATRGEPDAPWELSTGG